MTDWPSDHLAVPSLCHLFQRSAAHAPDATALRTPGDAISIAWRDYAARVESIARGLAALDVGRGDTVALMLSNRPKFHSVDAAVLHLGAAPFSVYNTLPAEVVHHVLSNAQPRVVVCETAQAEKALAAAAGTAVEHVVCIDGNPPGTLTLDEVEAGGDSAFDFEAAWRAVERSDVATIIYTSGTTGPPKGVELTHANILVSLGTLIEVLDARAGDRLISYLPAAHVADRFFTHYVAMAFAGEITCVADPRAVAGALPEVRPHTWIAVPRIWEKLRAALLAKIDGEPDPQRRAGTQWALDVGLRKVRADQAALWAGGPGPDDALLAEHAKARELVLDTLRAAIGLDRARWAMSGAAPVAPETLEFFLALGVPVCELYGMSEFLGGSINPPERLKLGTVGPALPGLEVRLEADGELLVRGATVMRGYRGRPEETAETIDVDGWLRTGDIVEIDADGYLRIVDRKKELIISAGGKNMSPVNIERAIKTHCPLVGQAVAIGDLRPYNVALLTLDPDALAGRAVDDPEVRAAVAAGIEKANEQLARVEQIKRFHILAEDWQPGGDELTPTMKLKRKPIATKYADVIEELYR